MFTVEFSSLKWISKNNVINFNNKNAQISEYQLLLYKDPVLKKKFEKSEATRKSSKATSSYGLTYIKQVVDYVY